LVIELGGGIEEAEDAGVDEVIEIDVDGEVASVRAVRASQVEKAK
jgi:uncharacterized protein YuzE